ncbi:chaperone modulator CbpM [Namhaeicola litoreus]
MEKKSFIPVEQFCELYHIEFSFIHHLKDYGLIEMEIIDQNEFIRMDHLSRIEKMIRLHEDLGVNFEGIDIIDQLLMRLEEMQSELTQIKNKLRFYE